MDMPNYNQEKHERLKKVFCNDFTGVVHSLDLADAINYIDWVREHHQKLRELCADSMDYEGTPLDTDAIRFNPEFDAFNTTEPQP